MTSAAKCSWTSARRAAADEGPGQLVAPRSPPAPVPSTGLHYYFTTRAFVGLRPRLPSGAVPRRAAALVWSEHGGAAWSHILTFDDTTIDERTINISSREVHKAVTLQAVSDPILLVLGGPFLSPSVVPVSVTRQPAHAAHSSAYPLSSADRVSRIRGARNGVLTQHETHGVKFHSGSSVEVGPVVLGNIQYMPRGT